MNNSNIETIASLIYEDYLSWKNINQIYEQVKANKKAGILSIKFVLNKIAEKIYKKIYSLTPAQIEELKQNFNVKDWEIISFIACEQKAVIEQNSDCFSL